MSNGIKNADLDSFELESFNLNDYGVRIFDRMTPFDGHRILMGALIYSDRLTSG